VPSWTAEQATVVALGALAIVLAGAAGLSYRARGEAFRGIRSIRLGAELIASVNPRHRLDLRTANRELQALAAEVNHMADQVQEASTRVDRAVAMASADLAVERRKLAAVLEALGEGVVVATADGRVSLANATAETLLGGPLLGRRLFDLVDREKLIHLLERFRARRSSRERFVLRAARGTALQFVATPFYDSQDQAPVGFVLSLRDVSTETRSDEERRFLLADALRDVRGPLAAIRSLSESLLAESMATDPTANRLLEALHAEAVRLSDLVSEAGTPAQRSVAVRPPHFERLGVGDLLDMAVRRLGSDNPLADRIDVQVPHTLQLALDAEASALSGAIVQLLNGLLAPPRTGRARLRASLRDRVVQLDVGLQTTARNGDLEPLLDTAVLQDGDRQLSVRDVIHQHTGEAWTYADAEWTGFRITLPPARTEPRVEGEVDDRRPRSTFVGAGLVSGWSSGEQSDRPSMYDFSLFDPQDNQLSGARDHRLRDLQVVVFDTETTGLDPAAGDRIVSVAGVKVRGGSPRPGETFDALVNPGIRIPHSSSRFHGITSEMVAEVPPIDVVLPALLEFAEGAVLVGHQVWFDLRFLDRETERLRMLPVALTHPVLDTALLAEVVFGQMDTQGLDALATRLGVHVRGRHSALGDALATAEIFSRLIGLLEKRGLHTLGQAIDAARVLQRGVPVPRV
jgi:DNA polymerase-3 subunit epsilon